MPTSLSTQDYEFAALLEGLLNETFATPEADYKPTQSELFTQQVNTLTRREQARLVVEAFTYLRSSERALLGRLALRVQGKQAAYARRERIHRLITALIRRKLVFHSAEITALFSSYLANYSRRRENLRELRQLTTLLKRHLQDNRADEQLIEAAQAAVRVTEASRSGYADQRQVLFRLNRVIGQSSPHEPGLEPGEVWSDHALAMLDKQLLPERSRWHALFRGCLDFTSSAPSQRWRSEMNDIIAEIGETPFRTNLLHWLTEFEQPRVVPLQSGSRHKRNQPYAISENNARILRGLIWLSPRVAAPELVALLGQVGVEGYRQLPQHGPRSLLIGRACIWALGEIGSAEALARLAAMRTLVKRKSAHKAIDKVLGQSANL